MPERLRPTPELARGGILISNPKDQTVVKDDLRRTVETATDWEYRELHVYLSRWANIFKTRLLDPILLTDRRPMPDPVFAFERMRHEILASYTLIRNPQGLLDEITLNTTHYVNNEWEYGQRAMLETLLHELLHLKQQNFGAEPIHVGKVYHNKEFISMCEAVGLHPRPGIGSHWKQGDGAFGVLMDEYGVPGSPGGEVPNDQRRLDWWDLLKFLEGKETKGKSSLKKYACPCGEIIRVGKKHWKGATCNSCKGEYEREGK